MAKKDNEMFLRQYLVTGQDGDSKKAAFILHTCAKSANDEFQRKYPGYTLTGTT